VVGLSLSSPEILVDVSLPLVLPPAATEVLDVILAPRNELTISGNLTITSDDPITPTLVLPIQMEILDLQVATNAQTETGVVPLGSALTILVVPADGVHVERGALHYRPAGETE
jgi:hypothetical protein